MRRILTLACAAAASACAMACSDSAMPIDSNSETNASAGRTLIAYYSFSGDSRAIANTFAAKIEADVVEITPAEKGLDYAANGYRIGADQVNAINANPTSAASYPAIDAVDADISAYANVIVVTPLWHSRMAAPMQSFLFQKGAEMKGKNVGLVVSSASSGISGVQADFDRLVPDAHDLGSLWVNNSNRSRLSQLVDAWLEDVNFSAYEASDIQGARAMLITIGGTTMSATLAENSSVDALVALLAQGPITYEAHDYGDFEKVGDIGHTLPQNNEDITTVPGDLILYQGRSLCIYYGQNTWDFTRIGKIDGATASSVREFVNAGGPNVTVTLSLPSATALSPARAEGGPSRTYALNGSPLGETPSRGAYVQDGRLRMMR